MNRVVLLSCALLLGLSRAGAAHDNVKAVAMEPATGFTFDTAGSTRPR
jgi:hypothetical protein